MSFSPCSLKIFNKESASIFRVNKKVNIEKLSYLTFESYDVFLKAFRKIKKNIKNQLISLEQMDLGSKYRKEILTGYTPLLYIRKVDEEKKLGLFTESFIPSRTFVAEYTGIVKKRSKSVMTDNEYCMAYPVHPFKRTYVIDAREKGNETRFINHSKRPNLEIRSVILDGLMHMVFFSLNDVFSFEELTFDYGELFWK